MIKPQLSNSQLGGAGYSVWVPIANQQSITSEPCVWGRSPKGVVPNRGPITFVINKNLQVSKDTWRHYFIDDIS